MTSLEVKGLKHVGELAVELPLLFRALSREDDFSNASCDAFYHLAIELRWVLRFSFKLAITAETLNKFHVVLCRLGHWLLIQKLVEVGESLHVSLRS